MKYHHIIIGGTFDRLHAGHQKIIDKAFESGEQVTIGIAERVLFKEKLLSQAIEDFQTRKKNILQYLEKKGWEKRVKFIPIVSFYGTTLTDKTIEAIVVSGATEKNARVINQARKKINFPKLEIIVVDDVLAEDGKLITSERIRLGEIDQYGNNFQFPIFNFQKNKNKKKLILPENLRDELRRPLGRVLKSIKSIEFLKSIKLESVPMIISVGDIVTQGLLRVGVEPDIKIVDFKTRREKIEKTIFYKDCPLEGQSFRNQSGTINLATVKKLKQMINNLCQKPHTGCAGKLEWLVVEGEEDLLTLPAILLAPLNSLVFYGQWKKGVVMVLVTLEIKNKVKKLLERFI